MMTGQHKLLVTALVCVGVVCLLPRPVTSHGRMWEPPGRSTMWRRGFHTPKNYNDNGLYCGGLQHQISQGYKCGTCGDKWDMRIPRHNEAGGHYGKGVISRTYTQGQNATFTAQITTNHLGWFSYKLCPTNNKTVRATMDCLNAHPVPLADGSGYKNHIGTADGMVHTHVTLPADLTCDQCVLQWRYHTGNGWGPDGHGHIVHGGGRREEFYGCADIKILPKPTEEPTTTQKTPQPTTPQDTPQPTTPQETPQPTIYQATTPQPVQAQTPRPTQAATQAPTAKPINSANCKGVGERAGVWDSWCVENCGRGYCPDNMCVC